MSASRIAWVTLAVLVAASATRMRAQSMSEFVGTWYSETKENAVVFGKPYDMRRELLNNRSDGTKTNTNRFYLAGEVVAEAVATYVWGVERDVYWTTCQTSIANGRASVCSTRNEYDIISVGSREIRYRSRTSGTTYSMIRVANDFRLP